MKFYENARRLTFPPLIIAPPLHTKATVLCEAKELISAHVAVRKTSRNKVTSNFAESVSGDTPCESKLTLRRPRSAGASCVVRLPQYGSFLRACTSETHLWDLCQQLITLNSNSSAAFDAEELFCSIFKAYMGSNQL